MGRGRQGLGKLTVALWAAPALTEVGRGVCGQTAAPAGTPRSCRLPTPAQAACSSRPWLLLLLSAQAVDVGHGSWLLAVSEKCPGLPARRRSYHSCREWRECSGNMKCDSCGFKFSRGPCLFLKETG